MQRATRAIKREVRDLVVVGDVCLCEYMSHGHCGIVQKKNSAGGSAASSAAVRLGALSPPLPSTTPASTTGTAIAATRVARRRR